MAPDVWPQGAAGPRWARTRSFSVILQDFLEGFFASVVLDESFIVSFHSFCYLLLKLFLGLHSCTFLYLNCQNLWGFSSSLFAYCNILKNTFWFPILSFTLVNSHAGFIFSFFKSFVTGDMHCCCLLYGILQKFPCFWEGFNSLS